MIRTCVRDVPKSGQQFDLVHAGDKFHRSRLTGFLLVIVRHEQHLAAGGIGSAVARRLLLDGASVALVDRDTAHLQRVAAELAASSKRVLAITADVSLESDVQAAASMVENSLAAPSPMRMARARR